MTAYIVPPWPDRQGKFAYQALHLNCWLILPEPDKAMADFHGHSEIDLIHMLGVVFLNNNMRGNNGTEVEQDEASPDFLLNVPNLFRMEINGADGMLKIPE